MNSQTTLENYFDAFRCNVIGNGQIFDSPSGPKQLLYADWTATGRAYKPIEDFIQKELLPFAGNTHTAATVTGTLMSEAYAKSKTIIKEHVKADSDDVLLFCGSGMTAAVNKLQRLMGLRVPGQLMNYTRTNRIEIDEVLRPVVFVTHMEHHSNHISWLETIATVEIIQPDKNGSTDLAHFRLLLQQYKHRPNKIAAITACSNVTGIETPYHRIAQMIHSYGGLCFVDFACSAPYADIDMHPPEKDAHLDAIYFSAHKFLGGSGTPGVLVFSKKIYHNAVPDQPGGGTLTYTNPWNDREYVTSVEQREDGGTPPFLQGVKAAMCIRLKEQMGVENLRRRDNELLEIIFERFEKMKNVKVLQDNIRKRLGVVSFIVKGAHYNLIVKLLNDRFGIQTRGGCSCAGTYGHMLLQVDKPHSLCIRDAIRSGDLLSKPGWIRLSIHPVMTDAEINFIMDAIEQTALYFEQWGKDYSYDNASNEFIFKGFESRLKDKVESWFENCIAAESLVVV